MILLTQRIFGENVVQNTVGCEFETILTAKIRVQHFQLCLTLIKLFVITFLHGDTRMRFIHLHREFVSNALYLKLDEKTQKGMLTKNSKKEMEKKGELTVWLTVRS